MPSPLLRRPVVAWALYDWANSAFATTVMAGFFPVFFKQYWSAGTEATVSTFRLGIGNGIGSFALAVLAPLIGAAADRGGARVKTLTFFTLLGVSMTAALYWVQKGDWPLSVLFYALASVGFSGGATFADSLLLDVAEPDELDVVSAYGYSVGYLGGGLLFAVNVWMTLSPATFGLPDAAAAVRASFLSVALWWAVFTLPLLLFVRERRAVAPLAPLAALAAGFRELGSTLGHIRRYRTLMIFLAAFWLYIDGVNTVIKMAVDYGMSIGLEPKSLITALLLTQFVAFPAALVFGWVGKRFGTRKGLLIAIGVYLLTTIWAYWLDSVAEFYAMAVVIGLVQGGVQSLSRSFYGRLVPPDKSGEFFGFFNLIGKFAAVVGPLLTGGVALLTGSSRVAILSLVLLFAAGGALLWLVPEAEARAEG
ncbi:MAG TPA: MFS transporter [Polyangiaceae bacterium]|jgi:UMF1 family MFS transporter|nr:MFS transporter [Polyangiaceae bacterium]